METTNVGTPPQSQSLVSGLLWAWSEGTGVIALPRSAKTRWRVNGGALLDGQARWLEHERTNPIAPQLLVLTTGSSLTGNGALSDSMMQGMHDRVAHAASLPGTQVILMANGPEATLMAVDPVVQGVRSALGRLAPRIASNELPGEVSAHFIQLRLADSAIELAGLLVGNWEEGHNRTLILQCDWALRGTLHERLLEQLSQDVFNSLRASGIDASADTVMLVSSGQVAAGSAIPDEEFEIILLNAFRRLIEGLLKQRGRFVAFEMLGAHNAEEVEAMSHALAKAWNGTPDVRTLASPEGQRLANEQWRRALVRSRIATLTLEDLTWMLNGVLVRESGHIQSGAAVTEAWQQFRQGEGRARWLMQRGMAGGCCWFFVSPNSLTQPNPK